MAETPEEADARKLEAVIGLSRALDREQMELQKATEAEATAKRCYDQAAAKREAAQAKLEETRERIRKTAKEL